MKGWISAVTPVFMCLALAVDVSRCFPYPLDPAVLQFAPADKTHAGAVQPVADSVFDQILDPANPPCVGLGCTSTSPNHRVPTQHTSTGGATHSGPNQPVNHAKDVTHYIAGGTRPPQDRQHHQQHKQAGAVGQAVDSAGKHFVTSNPRTSLPPVQNVLNRDQQHSQPTHQYPQQNHHNGHVNGAAAAGPGQGHQQQSGGPGNKQQRLHSSLHAQPIAAIVDSAPGMSNGANLAPGPHFQPGASVSQVIVPVFPAQPVAPQPFGPGAGEAGEREKGELRCGNLEYEVGEELCCAGTVHQVPERSPLGRFKCCGAAVYNSGSHGCCQYRVQTTSPQLHQFQQQHQQQRYVQKVISLATQTCCTESPAHLYNTGAPLACCGHQSYDPQSAICCNGRVLVGSYGHGHRCCGTVTFVTGVEACCGNAVTYNPKDDVCCGSKITARRGYTNLACCGSQPYHSSANAVCCAGVLQQRPRHNEGRRLACCGSQTYDVWSQGCCNGVVGYKTGHPCQSAGMPSTGNTVVSSQTPLPTLPFIPPGSGAMVNHPHIHNSLVGHPIQSLPGQINVGTGPMDFGNPVLAHRSPADVAVSDHYGNPIASRPAYSDGLPRDPSPSNVYVRSASAGVGFRGPGDAGAPGAAGPNGSSLPIPSTADLWQDQADIFLHSMGDSGANGDPTTLPIATK